MLFSINDDKWHFFLSVGCVVEPVDFAGGDIPKFYVFKFCGGVTAYIPTVVPVE